MYLTILSRILKLIGFEIVRFVHGLHQSITWRLTGIRSQMQDAKQPEFYDRCAQVLNIRLYFAFDPMGTTSRRHFICSHNRFENPRYIFENEHVTLMSIDEEYAMFAEASSKDMHLWKMEYSGFMKLAQVKYCNKLILIPRNQFHRMADELGDPKVPIIFLFSVGRCGSTLMTQIMESTNHCVSISEPGPLGYILEKLVFQEEPRENLTVVCRDIVRWICRPCPSCNPLVYFVKVNPLCQSLPVVYDAFPSSKYLFMYRNVTDVLRSFDKVAKEFPSLIVASVISRHSSYLRGKFITKFDMQKCLKSDGLWNDRIGGAVLYVANCRIYLENGYNVLPISAIRYEDIMSDAAHAIRKIFDYCQLPASLIDAALDGLRTDAQRNTPVSTSRLKKHTSLELDDGTKRLVNTMLQNFSLPLIGEDCLLKGTITNKH